MGSRIAGNPVVIPSGVEATLVDSCFSVKGKKGDLSLTIHKQVKAVLEDSVLSFAPKHGGKEANALAGTMRALSQNLVKGVSEGFQRKLILVGVGYRAQAKGTTLDLSLGFSHPVKIEMPEGISVETPSQTEIILKGADKQKVGQVAANIRSKRPPEPYKGKGIHYAGERVFRKEAKKK